MAYIGKNYTKEKRTILEFASIASRLAHRANYYRDALKEHARGVGTRVRRKILKNSHSKSSCMEMLTEVYFLKACNSITEDLLTYVWHPFSSFNHLLQLLPKSKVENEYNLLSPHLEDCTHFQPHFFATVDEDGGMKKMGVLLTSKDCRQNNYIAFFTDTINR